ncbi:MAG: hypothetical protein ACRYHQ_14480, partial [Janthinobacterium lividum]
AGAFSALPSGSAFSTTALTLALPSTVTAGTHTAQVRDTNGVTSNALTYTVAAASSTGTTATASYPTQAVVVQPFATSSTGAAPAATGTPPTVYQTFYYETGTTGATSATATQAQAFTAGSTLTILIAGGSATKNIAAATFPSGFARIADQMFCGLWCAAYSGPSSAVTGTTVAVSTTTDSQVMLVIEHNAQGVDVTAATLASNNATGARTYYPTAQAPASAASFGLVCTYKSAAVSAVSGATLLHAFAGVNYSTVYHAGAALQIAATSTPATFSVANTAHDSATVGLCLTVNLYASTLSVGGAQVGTAFAQMLKSGASPVPATLSGPSGGYPAWWTTAAANLKAGKQPFIPGFFVRSAPQGYDALMDAGYWLGRDVGALDFTDYSSTAAYLASNINYEAGYDASYGLSGPLYCLSTATISNDMTYADVAAGFHDAEIATEAQALIAKGVNLCRLDWESNEGYYSTAESSDPDMVVAARRRWVMIAWAQSGSQLIPFTAPLGVGGSSQVDDNGLQGGDDAFPAVGIDLYGTAYLDNGGKYTSATPAREQAINNQLLHAGTQSADWLTSITRGRPAILGEWSPIGLRGGDGYGIGDDTYLMQQTLAYIAAPGSNLLTGYFWNNDSGGTDSRIVPRTYYGPSLFPNSAALMQAAFKSTVQGTLSPPTLTISVASGNINVSGVAGASGDAPTAIHYQLCRTGMWDWKTMNARAVGATYNTGSLQAAGSTYSTALPTKPTDGSAWLVSLRACLRNQAGASSWIEVPLNLDAGTVGTQLAPYPSTWGLNSDGTYGPKLRPGELNVTGAIGSGTPAAATKLQDTTLALVAPNGALTATFSKALTAGSSVVIRVCGPAAGVGTIATPAGFTKLIDRNLAGRRGVTVFVGPSSALTSTTISLGTATDYSYVYGRETTGSYFEDFAITGSMAAETNVMVIPLTASQGGGDRFVAEAHDNTGSVSGVSIGTVVQSGVGVGQYFFQAIIDVPASASGIERITVPGTPLNIYADGVNAYTAAPATGNVVSSAGVNYINGVAQGASSSGTGTSTGGTTTSSTTTPTLAQPVAHHDLYTASPTVTLGTAPTLRNNAILFVGGPDHDASLPAGWAQLATGVTNSYHASASQAPVSSLTGNAVTLSAQIYGFGYLVETNGQVFDGSYINGNSNNTSSFTFNVPPASKAIAEQFAFVSGYVSSNATFSAIGATILASDVISGGATFGVLLSIPSGGGSVTISSGGGNANNVGVVCVNAYSS